MSKYIKSILSALLAIILSVGLSSCGSKADNLMKKQISLLNEYADTFEKDPKSAKLDEIQEKIGEVGKELNALDLSADEKKEMSEKFKTEASEAALRYANAKSGGLLDNAEKMMGEMEKALDK